MKNWLLAFIIGWLLGGIFVMVVTPPQRVYVPMYYERQTIKPEQDGTTWNFPEDSWVKSVTILPEPAPGMRIGTGGIEFPLEPAPAIPVHSGQIQINPPPITDIYVTP